MMAMAASPQIKFLETTRELGNIKEKGGKVSTAYRFVNVGDAPLVIFGASSSCGCTKPKFPEAPVAPGDTSVISVSFDPDGKAGEINKMIKVTSNSAKGATTRLRLKGVVIPPNR